MPANYQEIVGDEEVAQLLPIPSANSSQSSPRVSAVWRLVPIAAVMALCVLGLSQGVPQFNDNITDLRSAPYKFPASATIRNGQACGSHGQCHSGYCEPQAQDPRNSNSYYTVDMPYSSNKGMKPAKMCNVHPANRPTNPGASCYYKNTRTLTAAQKASTALTSTDIANIGSSMCAYAGYCDRAGQIGSICQCLPGTISCSAV
jgi:hypothetical protein